MIDYKLICKASYYKLFCMVLIYAGWKLYVVNVFHYVQTDWYIPRFFQVSTLSYALRIYVKSINEVINDYFLVDLVVGRPCSSHTG